MTAQRSHFAAKETRTKGRRFMFSDVGDASGATQPPEERENRLRQSGGGSFFSHFRGLGAVSESAVVHGAHLIELNARTHPSASSKRASTSMQKPTLHPLVPPPPPPFHQSYKFRVIGLLHFLFRCTGNVGDPQRRPKWASRGTQ